ncbi:MAG TPA: hypothetical protein VJI13_02460 [Candidatus Norongarragalinales archaeon]|nr:hypothetical protein [Candidatus Norongarragalinales archaeon]
MAELHEFELVDEAQPLFPKSKYVEQVDRLKLKWAQRFSWAMHRRLPGVLFGPATALWRTNRKLNFYEGVEERLRAHRSEYEKGDYSYFMGDEFASFMRGHASILRMARFVHDLKSMKWVTSLTALTGRGMQLGLFRWSLQHSPILFGSGFRETAKAGPPVYWRDRTSTRKDMEAKLGFWLSGFPRMQRLGIPYPGTQGNSVLEIDRREAIRTYIDWVGRLRQHYEAERDRINVALRQLSSSARLSELTSSKAKYLLDSSADRTKANEYLMDMVEKKRLEADAPLMHTDVFFDRESGFLRKAGKSVRLRTIKTEDGRTKFALIFDKQVRGGFHEDGFMLDAQNRNWRVLFDHLGINPTTRPQREADVVGLLKSHGFEPIATVNYNRTVFRSRTFTLHYDTDIRFDARGKKRSIPGWIETHVENPKLLSSVQEPEFPFDPEKVIRRRSLDIILDKGNRRKSTLLFS